MCGIFGWSFKAHPGIGQGQREAMASVLAVCNSTRGDQSWGLYARAGRNTRLVKEVGDICRASFASNGLIPLLMAHTRFSTHGAINKDNAHPHTAGNIILCHNGVIFNHEQLNKKYERTCEVDSQHLALHLSEGKDFSDVEGYGAIEWVDITNPDTIKLCRMSGGSLHVYGIKNSKGKKVACVWSSDDLHLETALDAAHLDYYPYERLIEGQVYEVHNGRLYVSKDKALDLQERTWTASDYQWHGITSGSGIPGTCSVIRGPWSAQEEDEEGAWSRWKDQWEREEKEREADAEKYVQAARLARDLGLTPVDKDTWADKDGELVDIDDLQAFGSVQVEGEEEESEEDQAQEALLAKLEEEKKSSSIN